MDVADAEGLVLNSLVRIRPVGKNGKECLATTWNKHKERDGSELSTDKLPEA